MLLPKVQSSPLSFTHAVWFMPAATVMTAPEGTSTSLGALLLARSPHPSCPLSPRPSVKIRAAPTVALYCLLQARRQHVGARHRRVTHILPPSQRDCRTQEQQCCYERRGALRSDGNTRPYLDVLRSFRPPPVRDPPAHPARFPGSGDDRSRLPPAVSMRILFMSPSTLVSAIARSLDLTMKRKNTMNTKRKTVFPSTKFTLRRSARRLRLSAAILQQQQCCSLTRGAARLNQSSPPPSATPTRAGVKGRAGCSELAAALPHATLMLLLRHVDRPRGRYNREQCAPLNPHLDK